LQQYFQEIKSTTPAAKRQQGKEKNKCHAQLKIAFDIFVKNQTRSFTFKISYVKYCG
jgi:hypothetical protein